MKLLLILTLSLFLFGCIPTPPETIDTKFKTGGEGEYQGTDIGVTWRL